MQILHLKSLENSQKQKKYQLGNASNNPRQNFIPIQFYFQSSIYASGSSSDSAGRAL